MLNFCRLISFIAIIVAHEDYSKCKFSVYQCFKKKFVGLVRFFVNFLTRAIADEKH